MKNEEANATNNWISVEDALPETFGLCRGKDAAGKVFPCFYVRTAAGKTTFLVPGKHIKITHWQPLSAPPKK